ncbi:MAG: hypothetical protein ACJAXA_002611 [Candidatus Aldehydirespiratoraceae bacterium]
MGNLIVITAPALDELNAETSWPFAFTVNIPLGQTMHEGHERKHPELMRELDNNIDALHPVLTRRVP